MGSLTNWNGEIEVDETFIGGKARNMHKHVRKQKITGTGGHNKAKVIGMIERGGKVRAEVVPDLTKTTTVQGWIRERAEAGSSLYTDAAYSFSGLGTEYDPSGGPITPSAKWMDASIQTALRTSGRC
jgi:hypothetical protein